MAIMVYTGVMGSGMTYEVVSMAALNALRQGRRVVTNIAGFNFSSIRVQLKKTWHCNFICEYQPDSFSCKLRNK